MLIILRLHLHIIIIGKYKCKYLFNIDSHTCTHVRMTTREQRMSIYQKKTSEGGHRTKTQVIHSHLKSESIISLMCKKTAHTKPVTSHMMKIFEINESQIRSFNETNLIFIVYNQYILLVN